MHAALSLLYLLPQPPIVYYGTEFDLSQHRSIHDRGASGFDEARLAIPWKTESMPETARLLRELSDFREANPGSPGYSSDFSFSRRAASRDLVTSGSH